MRARLRYAADVLRNSYWFTPGLMMGGAVGLSLGTTALDARLGLDAIREVGWLHAWIYTGGPDGAADVLSVIASSMITVAGVVFSITIVALTLASSQFGPRVLANFMADRGNQIVLGTFVATFLYSLLILRTIRGETADADVAVPHISVTVAVMLAIASLCVLIFFIHHVSVSIQAPRLINVIAAELRNGARSLPGGERSGAGRPPDGRAPDPAGEPAVVHVPRSGYVEAVDFGEMLRLAEEEGLRIRLESRPGHFVSRGEALARVWPAERLNDGIAKEIAECVATGERRTAIQDIEFPIAQLVEVAVRALSPGINDPFTAVNCIDHLGAGLREVAGRELPPSRLPVDADEPRLLIARPITFEGIVGAAFDQIRQNAAHHAAVHIRLLDAIRVTLEGVRDPDRLEPLLRQAALVLERSRDSVESAADLRDIEHRYDAVLGTARARRRALASPPP